MQVTFKIHFYTQWGQQMAVSGDVDALGNGQLDRAFILTYTQDGYWEGQIELPDNTEQINYRYVLIDSARGTINAEWGDHRTLVLNASQQQVWLRDFWRSPDADRNAFQSSVGSADIWMAFTLKNGLRIGAAYDYPLTKISSVARGSFELMMGYDFNFETKNMVTPRYF